MHFTDLFTFNHKNVKPKTLQEMYIVYTTSEFCRQMPLHPLMQQTYTY